MKFRVILFSAVFAGSIGPVMAQDDTFTPEQQEQIKAWAMEIDKACSTIPATPAMPAGDTATKEELLAAQKLLKAYIADGDKYLGCLDEVAKNWGDDIEDNQTALVNMLHNRLVDAMKSTADQFNTEVRAFKEKNAG